MHEYCNSVVVTCRLGSTEHNERQVSLRALRNRQDLFQEEGILNLILDAIDKITVITSQGYLVVLAGEEAGLDWDIISGAPIFDVYKILHSNLAHEKLGLSLDNNHNIEQFPSAQETYMLQGLVMLQYMTDLLQKPV